MKKPTILYTLYLQDNDYLKNFFVSFKHFARGGYPIIVVEQESENSVREFLANQSHSVDHVRLSVDMKETYFRTLAINCGLRRVRSETCFVVDSDVVLPLGQLQRAHQWLLDGEVMVFPYSEFYEAEKPAVAASADVELADVVRDPQPIPNYCFADIEGRWLRSLQSLQIREEQIFEPRGFLYGVRVKEYLELGGENPHMLDWGFEDHERYDRVTKLWREPRRMEGFGIHMRHARRHKVAQFKMNNFLEWLKVREMTEMELACYIKSWHSFAWNYQENSGADE